MTNIAFLLVSGLASAQSTYSVTDAVQDYLKEALRLISIVGGVGLVVIAAVVLMTISWVGLRRLRLIFFGVRVVRSFRRDE